MIEWYEGMTNNDPANDLGCYLDPFHVNLRTPPSIQTDRNSAHVGNEPSIFTPQVPQLPQQPLLRTGSDGSHNPGDRSQSRTRGGHIAFGIDSDEAPEHTLARESFSGSGSAAFVIPQSGTPALGAQVSPGTAHNPESPSLEEQPFAKARLSAQDHLSEFSEPPGFECPSGGPSGGGPTGSNSPPNAENITGRHSSPQLTHQH